MRSRTLTLTTALVSATATLLVLVLPSLHFAYRRPALHVGLETAAALIALLAAFLMFGRFRRSGRLDDLVLVAALTVLSYSNLVFAAVPSVAGHVDIVSMWAVVAGQLLGALLLAAASLVPARKLRRPRAARNVALVGALAGYLAVIAVLQPFADSLPSGVDPAANVGDPDTVAWDAHPLLLGVHLATMIAFGLASVAFTRRAEERGDDIIRWLAVAAVLAGFGRANAVLFPSLYSEWVFTADTFRLLAYVALLTAAIREIQSYWRGLAETAALGERRRIARDLHDGLAQELAFIVRRTGRVASRHDDPDMRHIATAARRALADSRRVIAALTRPLDEPLSAVLAHSVDEIASRLGVSVSLDLDPDVTVPSEVREALVRIACEAVANAADHAAAASIAVELRNGRAVRLRVVDDGRGFDPDAVSKHGFGLASMKERAQELGAQFELRSRPGAGTSVEVVVG